MPKNTAPADGKAMPTDAPHMIANSIAADVSGLAVLIGTIYDLANELPCGDDAGSYNRPLSDVIALLRIARDMAIQTSSSVNLVAEGRR